MISNDLSKMVGVPVPPSPSLCNMYLQTPYVQMNDNDNDHHDG